MGTYVRKRGHCSGQATFFIIVLLFLFASSIGVCVYFYFAKEHVVQLHFEKIDALNKKIITLSEYIKDKDIEIKDLKNSLILSDKELADLKSTTQESEDLLKHLIEIKSVLNQQFMQVNNSLSSGFGKVDAFSMTFDSKIEDYLNKSKKELTALTKDATKSDAIELPKVVVRSEAVEPPPAEQKVAQDMPDVKYGKVNPAATPQTEASQPKETNEIKVMKVNHQHAFFVINKGMIDGVKVGSPIEIYRHDVKIADAVLSEVRELVSLAKIEKQLEGHFIEEGDTARFK